MECSLILPLVVTIKLSLPPPHLPPMVSCYNYQCPVTTSADNSRHPPYGEQWVLRNIIPPPIKRNLWDGEGLPNLHSYSLLLTLWFDEKLFGVFTWKQANHHPSLWGGESQGEQMRVRGLSYFNLEHEDKWTFNCGSLIFYEEMRGSLKWR